jgi:lysozyme
MDTSPAGRAFITKHEGVVLRTYKDQRGIDTIGIGCTGPEAWPGRVITLEKAHELFAARLDMEFEPGVERALEGAPCTQGQFDAFVSLFFNVGIGHARTCTAMRMHKAGDYQAAAHAFLLFDKVRNSRGVLEYSEPHYKRREQEAVMYLSQPFAIPRQTYDRYLVAKAVQTALLPVEPKLLVDGRWGPLSRAAYDKFNRGE